MSIISAFGGQYPALDWAFGALPGVPGGLPAGQVVTGNSATGAQTITIATNVGATQGGQPFGMIQAGSIINVGNASNAEQVTVTSVSAASLAGFSQDWLAVNVTATFANTHGPQENVWTATFGLQEAIYAAAVAGSGTVVVTEAWYAAGGTLAMILAATIPTTANQAGVSLANTIRILDVTTLTGYALRYSSVTALAAPSIPLITQVASLVGVTGTFTAATYYVNFAYVDAKGGITLASNQYSFTATVSLAIGGSGPIAATGAVGYLVYTSATSTTYEAPVAQVTGAPAITAITLGGVKCFQIGTPFAVAAPGTSALAVVPVESPAYPTAVLPIQMQSMIEPFNTVLPPFVATGVLTATTALEYGRLDLPAGFLNSLGRTMRITVNGTFTPVSGATLIFLLELYSVYGHTGTVISTIGNTAVTSGTAAPCNFRLVYEITTAATGVTGTLETHCIATYQLVATTVATTGVAATSLDNTSAASGTVDLTKRDTLSFQMNSGTQNVTTIQARQVIVEVLA